MNFLYFLFEIFTKHTWKFSQSWNNGRATNSDIES